MTTAHDVIVLGAGVAGAAAAAWLAGAGWSVALVERRAFPRRKVCGECVAAPNLPLLDALGIGAAAAALAGPPLRRVALDAGDERIEADLPRAADPRHPWGRALAREHLDRLLADRAAELGAIRWQPWTATAVRGRPGAYAVTLRSLNGERALLRAPVLIDARGSAECRPCRDDLETLATARSGAAASTPRRSAGDLLAFKATFRGACLEPGVLPVLALPGGYGGMVLVGGDTLTLACCIRRDALARVRAASPGRAAGDAVERWLARCSAGVRHALDGAERDGRWLATGPLGPGLHAAWSDAGGFAVGNAAGEAHPILGEGISMALQGAALLAELLTARRGALLAGRAHAAVGRDYRALWRSRFAARVRVAAICAALAMRPTQARMLLPILRRRPDALACCARLGGKVSPVPSALRSVATASCEGTT